MDREMEQGKARAEKEGDREKQRDTERLSFLTNSKNFKAGVSPITTHTNQTWALSSCSPAYARVYVNIRVSPFLIESFSVFSFYTNSFILSY